MPLDKNLPFQKSIYEHRIRNPHWEQVHIVMHFLYKLTCTSNVREMGNSCYKGFHPLDNNANKGFNKHLDIWIFWKTH